MTKNSDNFLIEPINVSGEVISNFLDEAEISNSINEEDRNLIFVSYDTKFSDSEIDPVLSIYSDENSKFIRFLLMNLAPKNINKKNIDIFVENLNRNYIIGNFDASESDGQFYINCEYWLSFKFGLNPLDIFNIVNVLPSILDYAFKSEKNNF